MSQFFASGSRSIGASMSWCMISSAGGQSRGTCSHRGPPPAPRWVSPTADTKGTSARSPARGLCFPVQKPLFLSAESCARSESSIFNVWCVSEAHREAQGSTQREEGTERDRQAEGRPGVQSRGRGLGRPGTAAQGAGRFGLQVHSHVLEVA